MKSRLEEDLRISDLEGLVLNRLLIDVFKPKLCHEKDVLAVAFLVRHHETADHLILYLSEGPFNFINIEASSAPDQDGNYIVLLELDRSLETYTTLDQMLQYINQLAHTSDWHFKTLDTPHDIAWNAENFKRLVPQYPEEFIKRRSEATITTGSEKTPDSEEPSARAAAGKAAASSTAQDSNINYRLMAKIIERQITRSNLFFIKEFQKQIKRIIKDNRLILQHFKELKSDHQYLYKQLELHQKREKLALLREQQDFKRIRDLQDRLSNVIVTQSDTRVYSLNGDSPDEITAEPVHPHRPLESYIELDGPRSGEPSFESSTEAAEQTESASGGDTATVAPQAQAEPRPAAKTTLNAVSAEAPTEKDLRHAATAASGEMSENAALRRRGEEFQDGEARRVVSGANETPVEVEYPAGPMTKEVAPEPAREDGLPTDVEDPVNRLFSLGMEASDRKDYHAAIEHFTKITDLAPEEPRGYYNLAILYYRLKDYDTAHEYAKRALDLGARAARRILEKVETKQMDTSYLMSDTIEIAPSETAPLDTESVSDVAEPLEVDDAPAEVGREVSPLEAYESPEAEPEDGPETSGAGEEEAATVEVLETVEPLEMVEPLETTEALEAVEPLETVEPLEEVDDYDLPTFPVLDGIEPNTETEVAEAPPETFEYLDTMTISEIDLSSVEINQIDSQNVNISEPYEAIEEIKPSEEEVKAAEPTQEAARKTPSADDWTDLVDEAGDGEQLPEAADRPATGLQTQPAPEDGKVYEEKATDIETVMEPPMAAADTGSDATPAAPAVVSQPVPVEIEAAAAAPAEAFEDYFMLGLVASDQKDYRQAIACFQKFVEQAPEEPRGYYNLAILYYRLKDYESAHAHAQRALDLGARAAHRILEKIRKKQIDNPDVGMDTIEIAPVAHPQTALEAIPPATDMPEPEKEHAPTGRDRKQPMADFRTFESPVGESAEVSAAPRGEPAPPVEPLNKPGTDTMPEFPTLNGLEREPSTDAGQTLAETIEYMDTATISDIDLDSATAKAVQWENENVFEPSEPALKQMPEAVQQVDPEARKPQSDDRMAAEAVIETGEKMPASRGTLPRRQPPAETAPIIEAKAAEPEKDLETAPTETAAVPQTPETDVEGESTSAATGTPEDYFALGMAASDQKDYRQAIVLFQKFIEQAPEEPRGHYNLAILYYRQKDYASARHSAERALNLGAKAARRILDKVDRKLGHPAKIGKTEKVPKTVEGEKSLVSESAFSPESPNGVSAEEDTIVWDADELEEEVHTEDIEVEGSDGHFGMSDDIIFFDSSRVDTTAPVQQDSSIEKKIDPQPLKHKKRPERMPDKQPADFSKRPPKQATSPQKTQEDEEVERFFDLGQKAADQKEYLKAIQHFTKVTNLAPADPRGYYNLAIVSYRLKFYETAREHARRALELGAEAAKRIIEKIDAQQETV